MTLLINTSRLQHVMTVSFIHKSTRVPTHHGHEVCSAMLIMQSPRPLWFSFANKSHVVREGGGGPVVKVAAGGVDRATDRQRTPSMTVFDIVLKGPTCTRGPKGDSKSHCFSHKRFKVRDCFGFWDIDPVVIRQLINSDRMQSDSLWGFVWVVEGCF